MSKLSKITLIIVSIITLFAFAGNATADNTADKMEAAGYFCFNGGPQNWTHCLRAEHFGNPTVQVKVFSEDGYDFLGTELLLREDIYRGQPCPQENAEFWSFLVDPAYYACHR